MKFLDNIISKLLMLNPMFVTVIITISAVVFSFITTMSIAWFFHNNIHKICEYDINLLIFSSLVVPIIITPVIAYKLVKLGHNRNTVIEHLDYLSKYDDLTSLRNRRYALELGLREYYLAKRYKVEFSVILIDFDYFKEINDTYGHIIGDEALKIMSNTIKNNIRTSDILGRYGGDEFILFCPHTNEEVLDIVANKIRKSLSKTILINNNKISISSSIGCVSLNQDFIDNSFEGLIKKADDALYVAKSNGRNCVKLFNDK